MTMEKQGVITRRTPNPAQSVATKEASEDLGDRFEQDLAKKAQSEASAKLSSAQK